MLACFHETGTVLFSKRCVSRGGFSKMFQKCCMYVARPEDLFVSKFLRRFLTPFALISICVMDG